jgi:TrmH family RNA methyltransferase
MEAITSRSNPLFQELRGLAEQPRLRRESGRTLLDGEHLLEEALAAHQQPERLIFQEGIDPEGWLSKLPGVRVSVFSTPLFKQLSPVATPTGLLAVLPIPRPAGSVTGDAILIEDVQDPGNVGTILRSAAAAGICHACLSKGCAEAWSPKALRGGQGAQFRLQIHEHADLVGIATRYDGLVLASALRAPISLYELDLRGHTAFLFGNEGVGLSPELLALARPFSIPMPGGTESLNVSAAAAVCLFEQVRQRVSA